MLENLTLIDIEKELSNKLKECELVSDLRLTYQDFCILERSYKEILGQFNDINFLVSSIKCFEATTTTILVYEALYKYRKSFWDNIIGLLNIEGKDINFVKDTFVSVFNFTIRKYKLKTFKHVGGYKNITPMICHSGVPNSSLSTLFAIATEFIDIKDIGPEEIIENIKYFIRYKVDKTIYRFITNNEDRAKEFIYDLQVLVKEAEENDYSYEDLTGKFNSLEDRIINEYVKYRTSNEYLGIKNNKKKNYIIQPRITLDSISSGLIIILPSNIVKNSFLDFVEWHITTDKSSDIIKCILYEKGGQCISENKRVKVSASTNYKIKLIYEDEVLNEWQFSGFEDVEPFILFDHKGNLLKSTNVKDQNIYILMKNTCKLNAINIDKREFDINEKGYIGYIGQEIKFKEKIQQVEIITENDDIFKIEYRDKNNIVLFGKSEVFNDNYSENSTPIYSEKPPVIKIDNAVTLDNTYYVAIRNIKNDVDIKIPVEYEISNGDALVSLDAINCFKEKKYGEYDVRFYAGNKLVKILPFKFIPKIEISNDYKSEYPSEKGKYKSQTIKIICDKSIIINLDNTDYEVKDDILHKNYSFSYYGVDHFINGNLEIKMNNHFLKFSIKSKSRSICYSILNEGEDLDNISFSKEPLMVYKKELKTSSKLIALSFMDRSINSFKVDVLLVDFKDNILQSMKIEAINNKCIFIPLNKFYDTINSSSSTKFVIKIIVKNDYDKVISEFIPCVIKEEVVISKVRYEELDSGDIALSWISEGIKLDNELALKMYNIFKPWEEPLSLLIEKDSIREDGKRVTMYLKKDRLSLRNDTMYYFNIEDESDDLFAEEKEEKILSFNKDGLYNRNCNYQLEKVVNIEVLISNLVKAKRREELVMVLNDIKTYKITEKLSKYILNSIFFLHMNYSILCDIDVEDRKLKNKCIYGLCLKYIRSYNLYNVMEYLLEIDSYDNIKNLLDKLKIVNIDVDINNGISKGKREVLWESDEERAFLVEARSGISSKSILIKNICDLIGDDLEMKILGYSHECDTCKYKGNKGCISMYIKRRCNKRIVNLSEELLGSKAMYSTLFDKYNTNFKKKELDSLNWINDTGDNGVIINGTTYVETLFEWVEYYNNENRKKLYDKIINDITELGILIKKLTDNYEFKVFNKMLLNRKEDNKTSPNTFAYYCGVTILIASMMKYKRLDSLLSNKDRQLIVKLLMIFRKEMEKVYLRDLYVIEFYLIKGEGLYVDGSN
ncbi:hypothetical protein [Clostridium sp. UBA1652]|uniref:hypothetical protein n=1 Tax=Clostridium sp. UBA1652 TaxID=1946348 RepID=UPI00258010FD|nr:hypothetical protein [Clostridium sp. UBA1652]